ncbi:hypothetical protein [Emticicia sp. BO119]|uniref:hypothetical protein n=1 Tax=Emticicia sp. BO119 TaxID=2757768 RepID=UPI0015F08F1F|nr:hypothetical protein [Emticicia sp. BO119]MBA4851729.1 hypothetical protein [Emticicia sp. BO119]
MKKLTLLFVLLIGVVSLHFTFDDLNRFGTNQEEFKSQITLLASFKEFPGFKFYYSPTIKKACMSIPAAEQASAAKMLGKMVKALVMGASFKADYEKSLAQDLRNTDRNSAEMKEKYENDYNSNLVSIQTISKMPEFTNQLFPLQESIAENSKKALDDINSKDLNSASAEEKQAFKSMQTLYKRGYDNAQAILKIKPLLKSNPVEFNKQYARIMAEQSVESEIESNKISNEELLAQAAAKKDYKANIKLQLQQFLDESADVDFGAKVLKQSNGFENFENEAYREKSRIWKQCYRIGKPATMAFREIAQEWIKEL